MKLLTFPERPQPVKDLNDSLEEMCQTHSFKGAVIVVLSDDDEVSVYAVKEVSGMAECNTLLDLAKHKMIDAMFYGEEKPDAD